MQINIRLGGGMLLVLALVAVAAWYWHKRVEELNSTKVETAVMPYEVPVVMRTPGGLLEVSTVKAYERFTRADTKQFWGLELGTTVSQIQIPVVYRFHIELAKEWRFVIRGKTCIVRAPEIKPSLPVAFDTGAMQKYTQNGWARFNKQQSLDALERSLTAELEVRARSKQYRQLATEASKQTIREFVTQWLLKEQGWTLDAEHAVEVYFPGEPVPGAPAVQ